MANINKIKLSGTTYSIQDENATKTVELTQAQYDALPATAKTSNTLFIITDATAGDLSNYYTKSEADDLLDTKLDASAYTPTDLSNYYTKSETSGATEISTALNAKADTATTYTKTEVNGLLDDKADTATTYTKTEVDNAITAATSTKQDTLVSGTNIKTINNQSILGEGNITIEGGGGGGATYSAGTNIDIANDTISCTLPMKAEVNNTSIYFGTDNWGKASGGRNLRIGYNANALGDDAICLATNSTTSGVSSSIVGGRNNSIYKNYSFIGGGYMAILYNIFEASVGGQYNNSVSASTTFGDSGNTLFSVGNGTSSNSRHNAFEIRQNGDIYITKDGQDVKLQDQLGGGGGGEITVDDTLSSTSTNPVQNKVVKSATDRICRIWGYGTSGQTNIDMLYWATGATSNYVDGYVQFSKINGKKIIGDKSFPTDNFSLVETSAITTSVTSSSTDSQIPSAKAVNDKLGGLSIVKLTQAEYDALSPNYDSNTLYVIVN